MSWRKLGQKTKGNQENEVKTKRELNKKTGTKQILVV